MKGSAGVVRGRSAVVGLAALVIPDASNDLRNEGD